MTEKLFLVHTGTSKKYEVVKVDRDAGTITLKGEFAAFDDIYDPKLFKLRGYKLVKVEVND